jgi:hypothetical protein
MADYYTPACVTAPIENVPDFVHHILLEASSGGDEEALLDELWSDRDFFDALVEAGLIALGEDLAPENRMNWEWTEEALSGVRCMSVTRHDGSMHVCFDESIDYQSAVWLQWVLSYMPEETKFLRVEGANTASRAMFDAYGGFCVIITRDDIRWAHASAAGDRLERAMLGTGDDPIAHLDDVMDGLDWDEKSLKELCCTFIGTQGLDLEFRRFLENVAEGQRADAEEPDDRDPAGGDDNDEVDYLE